MTETPETLRKLADEFDALPIPPPMVGRLRAAADAWGIQNDNNEKVKDALRTELSTLRARLEEAERLVAAQAEDGGLWFDVTTAPEAYLQQALRRLHATIEAEGLMLALLAPDDSGGADAHQVAGGIDKP